MLTPVQAITKKAVVIVPIADLVGAPIKSFNIKNTVKDSYDNLAVCGFESKPWLGAPRIFQILFNEAVEIITTHEGKNGDEDECCIAVSSAYFITAKDHKPQNLFWTKTKNLLPLNRIQSQFLPETLSFKHPEQYSTKNTLVLSKPFCDQNTKKVYSPGTRFIYDPHTSLFDSYLVYIFDPTKKKFETVSIPKSMCITLQKRSHKEAMNYFVTILKDWANSKQGVIPYVWGGCSFTQPCKFAEFKTKDQRMKTETVPVYDRTDYSVNPCTGFDCAGIILRAAQICGIPYFFKNTYTLAHFLKSLGVDSHLKEGDLIWIPGHVMVVSDMKKNTLIEARGYSHGYGIVQEISLSKVFKNIKTYDELIHTFHTHTPLIRLNKEGKEVEYIKQFKLLKLDSVWDLS